MVFCSFICRLETDVKKMTLFWFRPIPKPKFFSHFIQYRNWNQNNVICQMSDFWQKISLKLVYFDARIKLSLKVDIITLLVSAFLRFYWKNIGILKIEISIIFNNFLSKLLWNFWRFYIFGKANEWDTFLHQTSHLHHNLVHMQIRIIQKMGS